MKRTLHMTGSAGLFYACTQIARHGWHVVVSREGPRSPNKGKYYQSSERKITFQTRTFHVIVSSDLTVRTQITETSRQILIQDLFRLPPPEQYSQEQLQEFRSNKHRMYGNQEGRCNGCKELLPFRNMTIDHITPQSMIADPNHPYHFQIPQSIVDNPDQPDNLQLLCAACNSTKGNRSQEYLINKLQEDSILR